MRRYLRLYAAFLRFSFSRALEFRLDFFFRVVMDVAFYAVHLAFFTVIYGHTKLLGGWDLDQIYIFVAGILFIDALHMTVVSNNLWWLPIYVNRGDLDYYLVRPVSSLFFLSLREFAANSFLNLVMACAILGWAVERSARSYGAGEIALFVGLLLVGSLVYYLVRMVAIIPVFWLHSARGLDELTWSLVRFSQRPHQIYDPWLRWTLLTVLPLALVSSYPAHALFSGFTWTGLAHALGVTTAMYLFVAWFWQRGLRAYASASS